MPVGVTQTVRLSYAGGALRADPIIVPTAKNLLAVVSGDTATMGDNATQQPFNSAFQLKPRGQGWPGMFAYQKEPAVAQSYSVPASGGLAGGQAIMQITQTGAAATFQTVPVQTELFDTDGIDDTSPEILDVAAGAVRVWVPGAWRCGASLHCGDPTGLNSSGQATFLQIAILAKTGYKITQAGLSDTYPIASVCKPQGAPSAQGPMYAKYPWTFGGHLACSGLWKMDRGDSFTFGVRAFNAGAFVTAPGASSAHPYVLNLWAYLHKPI